MIYFKHREGGASLGVCHLRNDGGAGRGTFADWTPQSGCMIQDTGLHHAHESVFYVRELNESLVH